MDDSLAEIVDEFIAETTELLDQLDVDLVTLEASHDQDVVARIFRAVHTVKGTSGFLGLTKLEAVTHTGENLLALIRDGQRPVTADAVTALLGLVDAVRSIVTQVAATRDEGDIDVTTLTEELRRLTTTCPDLTPPTATPSASPSPEHQDPGRGGHNHPSPLTGEVTTTVETPPTSDHVSGSGTAGSFVLFGSGEPTSHPSREPASSNNDERASTAAPDREPSFRHVEPTTITPDPVRSSATRAGTPISGAAATAPSRPAETSIRVDVGLLDGLMNLVGELVLARNQIVSHTADHGDQALSSASQRLNLVTSELQESVMKTRLQPIDTIWSKIPRVVRDLARSLGKDVTVEMDGKDTELDKTIIEAIRDPLTHLVRNAIDHGIEMPEDRARVGKEPSGTLRLSARHEGGQVNIEISDDGAGLNPAQLRAKALERGVITADQAQSLSDRDATNLIFRPGFSTASEVTSVSGRGVGMDVVRTNIEAIGGSVDVLPELGEGTTFRIKIPLTLAIIPALVVGSGGQRYAIPQVSLLELIRLDPDEQLEDVQGASLYRLRGQLLPVARLDEVLGSSGTDSDPRLVVVLSVNEQRFGLIVPEVFDTAEIVVKPLGRTLQGHPAFSGATIMGDGKVALILDVASIAALRHLRGNDTEPRTDLRADSPTSSPRRQLLLLSASGRRFAVPLSAVDRIEEVPSDRLEAAGHGNVMQHRDTILPVARLSDIVGLPAATSQDPLQLIVTRQGPDLVGVVVDEVHDIVEADVTPDGRTAVPGTLGSLVVAGAVIDLVDLEALAGEGAVA